MKGPRNESWLSHEIRYGGDKMEEIIEIRGRDKIKGNCNITPLLR